MGDKISIRFVNSDSKFENGNNKSVVLFSHWGGLCFLKEAIEYVEKLRIEKSTWESELFDPQIIIVDFIRHITQGEERIMTDLYLGADENDGDNFDNGHYDIDLATGKWVIPCG